MKCFLFGADNSPASNAGVRFNRLNAIFPSSWSGNELLCRIILPVAMDISNFHIEMDVPPGVGTAFTFTILKNGVATGVSVTVSDTATSGDDTTHAASFAAGDAVSIQSTPTGVPAESNVQYWNVQVGSAGGTVPLLTGLANVSSSLTQYGSMLAGHGQAAGWVLTEADVQVVAPTSGTLSNFYVSLSAQPGSSKSYTFTLMVNGAASGLAVTITGSAVTANNTVNSVAIVAGDTLTIRSVPTNSPAGVAPSFGIAFTPNNTGENFMGFGSANAPSTTVANYEQLLGIGNLAWSATESSRYMMPGPCTLRGLYVKLMTAPGVGASRTFTVRKSTGDTPLAVTISGTNTTGSIAANVTCAQGEMLLLKSTVSSSPSPAAATGGVHVGLLLYNDPKSPVVMIY